jgi:hypothetical protein
MTVLGLLFCKLLVLTGLGSLAPGTCFGGDTSGLGLDAMFLLFIGIIAAFPVASRVKAANSSVVLVIAAMTVVAAGSAAIVHYFVD